MKAIVYLRISQDRTGEEAGVTRQREDALRHAEQRGWEVVAVESDNDISAAGKRKRPGYEAMLAALAAGQAEVVIAWEMSRLNRNKRDEVRLYELCQERGVLLSLVKGNDLDFSSAAGRFIADVLGGGARMEIEQKSERQKRASVQAAKNGKRVGGRRPFGYDRDGVTIREEEARAVRDGFAGLLAGVPLTGIARDWNARGFFTGQASRKGEPSPWRRDAVRVVLTNPRYAGKRAYNGEIVADAVWPALVGESTWQAAVSILKDPGRRRTPRAARYLLSGLAICGVCRATVHAGGNARRGVRGYRCSGATGHFARMAEPIEEFVSAVMVGRLAREDAAALLQDDNRPDVDALRDEANALRVRLDALVADYTDDLLTRGQLQTGTERLRKKIADVETQLADAGRVDVLGPLVGAEDVAAAWAGLGVDRQRAVIDLLAKVIIHPPGRGVRTFRPETVGIEWK